MKNRNLNNIDHWATPKDFYNKLFHEHILPNNPEIRFIKGRLKFCGVNTKGQYVDNKPGMHDSMVVIFNEKK